MSPLTGLPVARLDRVIAVKIDNAPLARPQSGLDQADIVYEELVEGGTTRFLAIFSSQQAPVIGPVRSVRESDLPLLRVFGRVLFAFSGGNSGVKATVRRAPIINMSYDAVPGAYYRAGRRRDAINYMTSSERLLAARSGGEVAHDIGLRFGNLTAGQAAAPTATTVSIAWPRARTAFVYDPRTHRYLRSMDGRPALLRGGAQMSTPNIVIQYVRVTNSRYTDVTGSHSPYTTTTGTGTGLVLRDGRAIPVRWARSSSSGPFRYRDLSGADVRLRPGPVWVLLVPSNRRATTT